MIKNKQIGYGQGVSLGASLSNSQANKPKLLSKVKALGLRLWRDESGQGTAEYVLILVGVVGLAIMFRNKIGQIVSTKMGQIGDKISSFTIQDN